MMWVSKEALEKDWVISLFPNLKKLSKKTLLKQNKGFGVVVKDKFLRLEPHNPKTWVAGDKQRIEARNFMIFGSGTRIDW